MSSIAIVVGFAVMLFLPCAIALMGGREPKRKRIEEFSPYSDRVVNAVVKAVPSVIEGAPIAKSNAITAFDDARADLRSSSGHGRDIPVPIRDLASRERETPSGLQQVPAAFREAQGMRREPTHEPHSTNWDVHGSAWETPAHERDTYGREPLNKYLGRVEQAELEVVRARAVAARAQAEALAAVARAAIIQAEAAAVEAEDLEDDAADAVRDGRRAA